MESQTIKLCSYEKTEFTNDQIASFLHKHLDQFGDAKEDILKCIAFAQDKNKGGQILLAILDNKIVGAVILNNTGMSGYIPENILVYIAVDNSYRGKGIGKKLMELAIQTSEGNIALHCEPDNPALHLYEKLGFKSKYLEMRLNKQA
ncbi:GNAT family N-acetyltransferase [Flavobacterium sp. NRK1]|uniref:GNAT family N-acetyltransferase n=1 Tax=Flavobacterium sp. NRK1 TaxID=2954929 RepID=UPI002092AE4F|nr:GNAT family N-acetyltransferase [Flavobacterium sp. NRK1]MCO6148792.1 GNAT family N-acetyltransferase [Flavobacterium sp. NRK1]